MKEGDPADGFYVIKSGEVDIVTGEATGAPVGRLGPGEVFGEMALLTDSRRSASVVARGPVTAWRLSRVRFEALLGQERAIAHWMTASTLLALVTMPIAEALGFHPFIAVLVALIGGDHTVALYVNSSYAITYFASEGELFTHAQARPMLWLEALFRLLALLLSVPIWQLMGLM